MAYPGDEGAISRLQWPTVKINSKSSRRHYSGGFAAPASENTDDRATGFSDLRVVTSTRHQAAKPAVERKIHAFTPNVIQLADVDAIGGREPGSAAVAGTEAALG